jgi:hypothetical protein
MTGEWNNVDPTQVILSRLKDFGLKSIGASKWKAFCPLHENPPKGHKRSLFIARGNNGLPVLFCQACGKEKTTEILKSLGLSWKEIYAGRQRTR